MTNIAFNPPPEQRANCERLADHLSLGVTNLAFDMRSYCASDTESFDPADHKCGTSVCAVGLGPSLGIAIPAGCTEWYDYAIEVFGAADRAYDWLFHSDWYHSYPTAQDAADRIRYALEHGIPVIPSPRAMMLGTRPLPYTPSRIGADSPSRQPAKQPA